MSNHPVKVFSSTIASRGSFIDRSDLDVFSKMPLEENPVPHSDAFLPVVQIF